MDFGYNFKIKKHGREQRPRHMDAFEKEAGGYSLGLISTLSTAYISCLKHFGVFHWSEGSTQRQGSWILISNGTTCFAWNNAKCKNADDAHPTNLCTHVNASFDRETKNFALINSPVAAVCLFSVRRPKPATVRRISSMVFWVRVAAPRPQTRIRMLEIKGELQREMRVWKNDLKDTCSMEEPRVFWKSRRPSSLAVDDGSISSFWIIFLERCETRHAAELRSEVMFTRMGDGGDDSNRDWALMETKGIGGVDVNAWIQTVDFQLNWWASIPWRHALGKWDCG